MEEFWKWLLEVARDVGLKLIAALLVFLIGRMVIRAVVKSLRRGKMGKRLEPTVSHFLCNFINIALYILLTVTIVGILGVPLASVVTAIASAGVAIGLALQGSLSNLAGGIMILIFHPFRVGDFVEAGGFSGTVSDIDVFYTVLNLPDNRVVTIPNGVMMAESITNYSANEIRRVDLVFHVAYGSDVGAVVARLLEEATKQEAVLKEPAPFCRLTEQGESSLDFTLRVWVKQEQYWQVKFDLLEAVHQRLYKEGLEIPFRQLDVHLKRN
ncbi:MAG: mechanosensitive ion channel [Clostridia bacterium]|nr:mechanosensitive ion channel [Clostridia bacterium]